MKLALGLLTIALVGFEAKSAMSKEIAMYCTFKQPLYKFVDRFILPDKSFKKVDGVWQSLCHENDQLTILEKSAKCTQKTPVFLARKVNGQEFYDYHQKCKKDPHSTTLLSKYSGLHFGTVVVPRKRVWEEWDSDLNICKYFEVVTTDGFDRKERPWFSATQFFLVESTDNYYTSNTIYDFESKIVKYDKSKTSLEIPAGFHAVTPSDGVGNGHIRDVLGKPWAIIDFNEPPSTFDCEKIKVD